MAETYTIAAAARLCHCDRRTLQRAIRRGTLHLDANHCLSREDLLLAGYLIAETPLVAPQATPHDMPLATPLATPLLPLLERLTTALEGIWHELQRLQPAAPTPQIMPLSTPQAVPQPSPQVAPQAPPPPLGPPDRQPAGPTEEPAPASARPLARGQRKLTPRQIRALRDKHLRGVPVPALMEEYGVSRISVYRYLRSPQRREPPP